MTHSAEEQGSKKSQDGGGVVTGKQYREVFIKNGG